MLEQKLKFIYKGSKTKRFHMADTLTAQTVGEHSFGVAWLVTLLYPQARKEVLLAALAHDLGEHLVGDVSSPAKRQYPELGKAVNAAEYGVLKDAGFDYETQLTDTELRILKMADNLDGMMFCIRERRMGSKAVVTIYNNFYRYVNEFRLGTEPELFVQNAKDLTTVINNMWEKYHGSK